MEKMGVPHMPKDDIKTFPLIRLCDSEEAVEFLKSIWGLYTTPMCYSIVMLTPGVVTSHYCGDIGDVLKEVKDYLSGLRACSDIYFQVLPLSERPKSGRGAASLVKTALWAFADLDFKEVVSDAPFEGCVEGEDHRLECYYRDGDKVVRVNRPALSEVLEDIRTKVGVEPTMVVDSGAGYHVYYQLPGETPINEWRQVEEHLVKLLGGDPQAKDPARIMRLPGSVNPRVNRQCRVIHTSDSVLYPDDLIAQPLRQDTKPPAEPVEERKLQELSAAQIKRIVSLLERAYVPGYRQALCLYLSGWGAKNNISPLSIAKVIRKLYDMTGDTDPLKDRGAALVYTYKKYGIDIAPYADELELILGTSPYGLERAISEGAIKGYTGLYEVLRAVLGAEEANNVMNAISEVVEFTQLYKRLAVLQKKVKPSRLDRLAAPLVEYLLSTRVIRAFYNPHRDEILGIYCFDGRRYRPCETQLEGELVNYLKTTYPNLYKMAAVRVVNEVIGRAKLSTLTPLHYEPRAIAFNNGVLSWECLLGGGDIFSCVEDPSPDKVVFHHIPHNLRLDLLRRYIEDMGLRSADDVDPMAFLDRYAPRIAKALRDWVGDKAILLVEAVGYVLYPSYDLHKAFMLVGDGANGKSTYLRLLKDIVGVENAESIALQNLVGEEGRFMRARLYHKLLNVYADLPQAALRETGEFKILTGEDAITADRKFRDPITFVNYAKLFFSANVLPQVYDNAPAFWRRWIVIDFPNKFAPNPGFYDTLRPEIEPLIVAGVLAFKRAWHRKKFSFEGTEADYRHQWQYAADSVYAFLYDAVKHGIIKRDDGAHCEAPKLYELYAQYCSTNERETIPKEAFTKRLEMYGIRRVIVHGRRYYKGITILKDSWETEPAEPAERDATP